MSLSSALDNAKRESVDWKNKYDHNLLQQKADESKLKSQIASLESRVNISEGRLSAVREQAESAQEEASEWKRKYEVAVSEAKTALQRAAVAQERTNKKVQEREDALRAELASQLSEKVILSLKNLGGLVLNLTVAYLTFYCVFLTGRGDRKIKHKN